MDIEEDFWGKIFRDSDEVMMKVGILGGGISGIGIQHFLEHPSEVLEASPKIGGLCSTIFVNGFGYDIGGHILFSKHEVINKLVENVLGENLNYCKRANKILYNGKIVKYPFENGLGALEKDEIYECLHGYLKNDYPKPTNLKEWCYHTFGKGISEKYLIPYNEKIWNWPSDQTEMGWVERIPKPPMEDILKSALGIETEGYLHQLYFKYPRFGGVEALVNALVKKDAEITCNYRIRSIARCGAEWLVSDGKTTKNFDRIALTFPIHEAIDCFENVPAEVRETVRKLRYNTVNVVFIAVNDQSLLDHSAIYIPDPSVVTHRVCFMGFFSRELVKPGTSSLIAEITSNPGDGVHELNDSDLISRTVQDLDRIGLIKKNSVIVTHVTRAKYGYPVYDLDYREKVAKMRNYFSSIGVDLCGRFAEFDYINSDECLRRAMALAEKYNAVPSDGRVVCNA